MAKDLTYGVKARERLLSGSEKLAKTVSVTMGPQGKNVILGKYVGAPVLTKDGGSVAREIELRDPIENLSPDRYNSWKAFTLNFDSAFFN